MAIGRYVGEFVDGATGANSHVYELWNQAQDMWGLTIETAAILMSL